jgi:hypothetical protein
VLVAGEEAKESLSTWPRAAAAAQQSSGRERVARERQKEGGRKEEGSGQRKHVDGGQKKNNARRHGLLVGRFFSFFENLCFFIFSFLFLLIFYSC